MTTNTRFAVAIHIMTALAYRENELMTSEQLAKSVNTNAVVVRRMLSLLVRAGLVEAREGKSGGSRIRPRPTQVALYDIYRAVEAGPLFAIPEKRENKSCPVSCQMKDILREVFRNAEISMESSLKKTSLADLLEGF